MERLTTEAAQRRLLEALADLQRTPDLDIGTSPDPLAAVLLGVQFSASIVEDAGEPGIARIYQALGDLVAAVRTDLKESAHG